ncbi:hypothetical protein M378DRAFT_373259 [Amanita muscaria Koide BX008]|uniref:Uncharacterized protein n=1 Tax=Amanita muscaria (strain Koide BX008) TaxID=946122 RepID=A0A0C2TI64_AMAMK|nr:hypothetical protein M378DRAFT_373259 [Amanita muscaria Koide BX008]
MCVAPIAADNLGNSPYLYAVAGKVAGSLSTRLGMIRVAALLACSNIKETSLHTLTRPHVYIMSFMVITVVWLRESSSNSSPYDKEICI